jgi:SNF2 family DNA or RNA helicase
MTPTHLQARFADKESFLDRFGDLADAAQVGALHTALRPYMLRRLKEDVETLPGVVDVTFFC